MPANICWTRRLSGPRYSFAFMQHSLHDVAKKPQWNIRSDLHFPYFPWKNEVNHTVTDFLVMVQRIQDGLAIQTVECRQPRDTANRESARAFRFRELLKRCADS